MKNMVESQGRHVQSEELSVARIFLKALAVSLALTGYGWAAFHFGPRVNGFAWVIYPGLLLEMPGGFVGALLDLYFSPQGGHGEEYMWVTSPVNLVFYFAVFFYLFRGRARRRVARPS